MYTPWIPENYLPLLAPYYLDVTVVQHDNTVEFFFPAQNIFIPYNDFPTVEPESPTNEVPPFVNQLNTSYGRGGYILTVDNQLPECLRHNRPEPYAFELQSSNSPECIVLYFMNDGGIILGSRGFLPLYNPQNIGYNNTEYFFISPASFSYALPLEEPFRCKVNTIMQAGLSNLTVAGLTPAGSITGPTFINDAFGGYLAAIWAGNPPGSVPNLTFANLYISVSKLKPNGDIQTLGTPVNIPFVVPFVGLGSCFGGNNTAVGDSSISLRYR